MPIMPGIPYNPGRGADYGAQTPVTVVAHRTYGNWAGDYAVGIGTSRPGVGFHFLVGKDPGQWVQFYDTSRKTAHAKGGNTNTIGIEVSGVNEDAFTDWQVARVADILSFINQAHGIAIAKYPGNDRIATPGFNGVVDHNNVAGSDHGDLWTASDWQRIAGSASSGGDDLTPEEHQRLVNVESALSRIETWLNNKGYLMAEETHGAVGRIEQRVNVGTPYWAGAYEALSRMEQYVGPGLAKIQKTLESVSSGGGGIADIAPIIVRLNQLTAAWKAAAGAVQ